MRTTAPVASVVFVGALGLAVVWQGVDLWRPPHPFTMPLATPPTEAMDLGVQSGALASDTESTTKPPVRAALKPDEAAPAAISMQELSSPAATGSQSAVTDEGSPNAPSTPRVDETALRYFAVQGDTRRLNAEIARLRSLYPDWTPPRDPSKAAPVADPRLDHMWQLYAQGRFEAVRDAIAERQSAEAGWTPPQDLLERLALADTRERLVNASDAKQYGMVVKIAATTPALRTCGDVDVLWRLAEAFVRTDRESRALDAYRYILTSCTNGPERIATMRKAAAMLSPGSLAPLFALGLAGPEADAFRSIREDLARRAVAAGGADAKADASEEDIAMLERLADAGPSPADSILLGWYFLRRGDATRSEHWFRVSHDRQNAAESARGLALSLLVLKRPAEAEAILGPWRDANDDAAKAYVAAATELLALQPPPVIASDALARIVDAVAKRHDAAAAQQLGWYSHAFRQDETAARWFSAALAWKPDDEPSAFGLAVVDSALNRRDALGALARVWRERSPRILALLDPAVARRLAVATKDPTVSGSAPVPTGEARASQETPAPHSGRAAAESVEPSATPRAAVDRGARMAGAWRLLQLNRPSEAAAAFRALLATGTSKERQDMAYGLSLANLSLGLTADADIAIVSAPQTNERVSAVGVSILAQRIGAAYNAGDYADALIDLDIRARAAPEPTDLMMLRGWSYYHLQRFDDAARVFEAVAATGNDEAISALGIVKELRVKGKG